jgi:hypothetical protein
MGLFRSVIQNSGDAGFGRVVSLKPDTDALAEMDTHIVLVLRFTLGRFVAVIKSAILVTIVLALDRVIYSRRLTRGMWMTWFPRIGSLRENIALFQS